MPIQTESLSVLDILRSIPDSVLTIDREKHLIAMNGPAEALTGTTEGIASGRPCVGILKS